MTDKHFGMDIEMKMSLGNLITIGLLVVTIVTGWATFRSDLANAKLEIARNIVRIERLETQGGEMKDRLTRMEVIMQNIAVQVDRLVRLAESRGDPSPQRLSPP
ncbi:hypothetical protein GA830_12300 [Mesorhizobium sp. NBSH29]|uniref:hypothetical protein n=1 Tax=Mesorhizobium sp. NBSH29 TaxID=2654249 RepID=UPI0018965B90|nr:hypothetical protein [Mesorhizobium sp. NBSH29]QPC87439.1 hypothetical protein GA830_12300 [Mesorhizobium sp. NBSH29]